jgi:hypothetical protein
MRESTIERVIFCCFDGETRNLYREQLGEF